MGLGCTGTIGNPQTIENGQNTNQPSGPTGGAAPTGPPDPGVVSPNPGPGQDGPGNDPRPPTNPGTDPVDPGDPGSGPDPENPTDPVSPDPGDPAPAPADPPNVPAFEPLDSVVRRLTRDQVAASIQDVLDVTLSTGELDSMPVDRPLEGFVNISTGQTVLPEHVRGYWQVADAVAERVNVEALLSTYATCRNETRTCADGFVENFGEVLFRRPMDTARRNAISEVFETAFAEGLSFADAMPWALRAMIQSPYFLYLVERETEGSGGVRTLDDYDVAARLSYGVWGTTPDEALRSAAAAGELSTISGRVAALNRLLSDTARAGPVLDRFILDWARIESIPDDDGLREELIQAASAYYRRVLTEDRPLFELLSEPVAVLTPSLAAAQGVASQGPGLRTYAFDASAAQGGLLAQPGVLAGMTNADGGAIVVRGLFMEKQLFCREAPDPPASLQSAIDDFAAAQPPDASQRAISETRMMRTDCAPCHNQFDPLAFGLEAFDFRGAVRTEDEHGNFIRTDGWIPAFATGNRIDYAGYRDYVERLADLRSVRRCLIRRQMEFFVGRRMDAGQLAAVERVLEATEADGGRLSTILQAVVRDEVFTTREVMP